MFSRLLGEAIFVHGLIRRSSTLCNEIKRCHGESACVCANDDYYLFWAPPESFIPAVCNRIHRRREWATASQPASGMQTHK